MRTTSDKEDLDSLLLGYPPSFHGLKGCDDAALSPERCIRHLPLRPRDTVTMFGAPDTRTASCLRWRAISHRIRCA